MKGLRFLKSALAGGASVLTLVHPAVAKEFDVPDGDLSAALVAYMKQSDVAIIYADGVVRGHRTGGAKGDYTETAALTQILRGTGFTTQTMPSNALEIVPEPAPVRVAQVEKRPAAPSATAAVETVVVTAQKKAEDIQQVPIAVTALSQKDLTDRQIAAGPDLLRDVPNMNFTKTNFSGYDIQLRGIGTQAVSVTTDPAVAVAFNDTPFIRNHFFEQEFFDVQDVEVLMGPQGTLFGRNATAGVVNLKSALPTDTYEAMLSADLGNFNNRRLEGMINIPVAGDKLDIRFAGEWTKRDGYTEDTTLDTPVDGRDLWSGRMTIGWNPSSNFHSDFIWEHFSEDDDRLRSGKQLCETDSPPASVDGVPVPKGDLNPTISGAETITGDSFSQGCKATSLYAPSAFQVPDGFSLPYNIALGLAQGANPYVDPYASTTQSTNLRQIESAILPTYRAKNDTLEFNAAYTINPALTLTSQTGYNQDFLYSTEDYNRFDTSPGIFAPEGSHNGYFLPDPAAGTNGIPAGASIFCDPQVGCSDRIVAEDLSVEHAWQLSQEFRLASDFKGPLNFSAGLNYLHYETEESYYVFINALTAYSVLDGDHFGTGKTRDHSDCLQSGGNGGYAAPNPILGGGEPDQSCVYIDTNPIGGVNNKGHNYFLSQNPYVLNSYAGFGELYYNLTPDLKLTTGLRYTIDEKRFTDVPSEVIAQGYGYTVTGIEQQQWDRLSGRAVLNWTPQLAFTDQTLVYGSYAHGYKAGGANPPGAIFPEDGTGDVPFVDHPLTFKPEYIEAFELGTKNTLFDNALTLNGDVFYYNYTGYQISEIVDRTAINNNYNAHIEGAEVTANWEPTPGLKFNLAGGWEDTGVAGGTYGIDLMDRTAGMPGWMVVKPFPTQASNCILPTYVVAALLAEQENGASNQAASACQTAYNLHLDPATELPYVANPTVGANYTTGSPFALAPGYIGFNPNNPAINNGQGFAKNLSGHQLPNAPPFTLSFGTEYSLPVSEDWIATLRGDLYWQADSWARIFNDNPYDRLQGYTNLNLALILTSANGWQVMGYVKNVFNTTAITGDFLNSDDSGLTTNVFLTDPRLYGIRVTKHLDGDDGFWGKEWSGADWISEIFGDADGGRPSLWIELGGDFEHVGGQGGVFAPPFLSKNPSSSVLWKGTSPLEAQRPPLFDFGDEASLTFQPDQSDWIVAASIRVGRSSAFKNIDHQTANTFDQIYKYGHPIGTAAHNLPHAINNFSDTIANHSETHAILDFLAGRDVGLGMFGLEGSSVLSGGIRVAQFMSHASVDMRARPDLGFHYNSFPTFHLVEKLPHFHTYHATGTADRKFQGLGPAISWKGSAPLDQAPAAGGFAFDWGANAALLFGRQKTRVRHLETGEYRPPVYGANYYLSPYANSRSRTSSRSVTVPNLGGFAGISYRYANAKIALGYRTDFFFGAIDGGIDHHHSETLNTSGPFATISLGLGG